MYKHIAALMVVVLFLMSIGFLMVFDTTAAEVLNRSLDKSTHQALFKQIAYACMGFLGAAVLWRVGYDRLLRYSGPALIFFTFCLVLVFVPKIGQQINGARRWVGFGGISFQPSEFVKYLIPIYYIQAFTQMKQPVLVKDFLKLLLKVFVPIGLILIEPDNGTCAIIFSALVVLFFLTRVRALYWAVPMGIVLVLGGIAASQMPHVPDRIRIYLHPELDLKGKGHQPFQAKIAAGSGGLFGKGPAQSMQKLDYLPEARSDYIAAIFAEEFGFIGVMTLILVYMSIGYIGFYLAQQATDIRGFYLIAVLTYLICFQAFLNLGVVSGLLPSKGTNLPFVSQGGSSLLTNILVVGLIINVAIKSKENACAVKLRKKSS